MFGDLAVHHAEQLAPHGHVFGVEMFLYVEKDQAVLLDGAVNGHLCGGISLAMLHDIGVETCGAEVGAILGGAVGADGTRHALALIPAAERVENAVFEVSRKAQAENLSFDGPIRVTLVDLFATHLLMADLVAFCRRWPDVDLHVCTESRVVELSRQRADVAVRSLPHRALPGGNLVGRKVATVYQATYGSGDSWIGWSDCDADWVRRSPYPDLPLRGVIGNPAVQLEACSAGLGRARLPCWLADPHLPRLSEPEPAFDVWLLVHPDHRNNPRLRVFRDAMVQAFVRHREALEGRKPAL